MIKEQDQREHMLSAKGKHSNMHQATGGDLVPGLTNSDWTKKESKETNFSPQYNLSVSHKKEYLKES